MSKDAARHRIAVLALPGVVAFDLAIPAQIFGHADQRDFYAVRVCSVAPGSIPSTSGYDIGVAHGLTTLGWAHTVVVPGWDLERTPDSAVRALARAYARGARIVSICTGAFLLAAAGLLDGRRATTHWMHTDDLAASYPRVEVDPSVLYVDEGRILTSAGIAAGMDLCLHLLARDRGAAVALAVSRRMVTPPHRDGGQAQFIPAQDPADLVRLRALADWVGIRLHEPLAVADLARATTLSPRSLHRLFVDALGRSPHAWLTEQRIDRAMMLLRDGDLGVDEVAARSGLGTGANLRLHLRRAYGTSPSAYRRAFSGRT